MKKTSKKLSFKAETVRLLTSDEMRGAAGGSTSSTVSSGTSISMSTASGTSVISQTGTSVISSGTSVISRH